MPQPFPHLPREKRGTVQVLYHDSAALKSNFWGDPFEREIRVYTPPGHAGEPLPALLFLPGYSGTGEQMLNRGMQEVPFSSRADRWISEGCPRFIAVLPDVMTRLGGSQYVDSPAIGNYATWLGQELPAWLSTQFAISDWGVLGRSSGGFGAIHLALSHPGRFSVVGSLSGDCGFDLCYLGDIPQALLGFGVEPHRFLELFWGAEKTTHQQFSALNLLCMSCAYSPDPTRSPFPARLPFDLTTGEVDFSVLEAWKQLDPVHRDLSALKVLQSLWLDWGHADEYLLQFGGRRLAARLQKEGIPFAFEEFKGGHRHTSWRYDIAVPRLLQALSR